VSALRDAAKKASRSAELGPLEISITPPGFDVPDKAAIDAYSTAGVDRLILRPRPDMDAAGARALRRGDRPRARPAGLMRFGWLTLGHSPSADADYAPSASR